MNACFGGWAPDNSDRLARSFARSRVCLGPLAAHRQAAQVANATIALDALQALQIHADFPPEIAFNDILPVLDGMDNLGKLLLRQILGADAGIDLGLGQDIFCVAGANSIDVAEGNVDALVRRNFNSNYASHIL